MSPPGRPKGEYRSAQHEGTPVNDRPDPASERPQTSRFASSPERRLPQTGSGPSLPQETASQDRLRTPALARRMACFVYEGVLLIGVLMAAGLLYAGLTGQRHALLGRHGLQAFLFVVLAVYFSWFWSHGGQTVAMKTWRIRLLRTEGAPVSLGRAVARYVLSWLWFAPGLLLLWIGGAAHLGPMVAVVGFGIAGYAALTRLNPDRQFWHDTVCGTRLVVWHPNLPLRR